MIADAFASRVSSAVTAFSCTSGEPVDFAHAATSSIAAASACWLCKSKVRTSAVAMWASELSVMAVVLEGYGERVLAGGCIESQMIERWGNGVHWSG